MAAIRASGGVDPDAPHVDEGSPSAAAAATLGDSLPHAGEPADTAKEPLTTDHAAADAPSFDLSAVMEQVHFAFRPESDDPALLSGGHSTFTVRVQQGAFELRAFHDPHGRPEDELAEPADESTVIEGEPVTFETIALGRADDANEGVPLHEAAAELASDGHVTMARPGHVEHLRNGRNGVEQSWSFAQRPSGRGDLVVRIAAEGLPMVGATDGGLHFADATGLGVRYGHAVWIAAGGARTEVSAVWNDGAIELRVPGDVVDTSAYPAVLDPVVGPEFGLDEPVLAPSANGDAQPAIASNGTDYLVVWSGSGVILGTRVTAAGVVLDVPAFRIGSGPGSRGSPAVASNGTDYLVAWEDLRDSEPASSSDTNIYGARVTSAGVVLDSGGMLIGGGTNAQESVSLASVGDDYLVVWGDRRAGTRWDVYGTRVSSAGTVENSSGVIMVEGTASTPRPYVAANPTGYLLAWTDYRNDAAGDIRASRVSSAGSVLDAPGFVVSNAVGGQTYPCAASNGTDYYVAWRDARSGSSEHAHGTRVTSGGAVLEPESLLLSSGPISSAPSIASNGAHYLVTWSEGFNPNDIYANRVRSDGRSDLGAGVIINNQRGTQNEPVVASNGNGFTVAWTDLRSANNDIVATGVTSSTVVADPLGTILSTANNGHFNPAVASNGSDYFVVWVDYRYDADRMAVWETYGTRVSASGVVQDPFGLLIDRQAAGQIHPEVASNGSDYLVVWGSSAGDILGRRVTSDGVVRDAGGLLISGAPNRTYDTHVASNGEDYLVVWSRTTTPSQSARDDIYGARVTSGGTVLDPAGIPIGVLSTDQRHPRVASNGTDYLVVWDDRSFGIYGGRVTSGGAVQDVGGFLIAPAPVNGYTGVADVASTGTDYMVVWVSMPNLPNKDVVASRVSSSGVVEGTSPIAVSATPISESGARITSTGSDYIVVWFESPPDYSTYDVLGTRLTSQGVVSSSSFSAGTVPLAGNLALASRGPNHALLIYPRSMHEWDAAVPRTFGRFITEPVPDGNVCPNDETCTSGFCVDGVCCSTECGGGGLTDCMACSAQLTGGTDGVCGLQLAGTTCGDLAATDCSAADTCDSSGTCLPNHVADDTPCEAGLFCHAGDLCAAGVCAEGTVSSCGSSEKCDEAGDDCYPACGDGLTDMGEDCDDGPSGSATCTSDCRHRILVDAGTGDVDLGVGGVTDAGTVPIDHGVVMTDAGMVPVDHGVVMPDAAMDAGSGDVDLGGMPDAGVGPVDLGMGATDLGIDDASADAAADDAGPDDGAVTSDATHAMDASSTVDSGTDGNPSGGGCGCSVPTRSSVPGGLPLALAALLGLAVTHRKRHR